MNTHGALRVYKSVGSPMDSTECRIQRYLELTSHVRKLNPIRGSDLGFGDPVLVIYRSVTAELVLIVDIADKRGVAHITDRDEIKPIIGGWGALSRCWKGDEGNKRCNLAIHETILQCSMTHQVRFGSHDL